MTSLPEPIADTYKRYKRGTNTVIDWICRYGGQSISRPRSSKSKSKKKRTGGPSSDVQLRDLPSFAKAIVDNNIKVPSGLLYALKDVIGARTMCARWYRAQSTSQQESEEECHKHEHFIQVLEEIYTILKPAEDVKTAAGKTKNKAAEPEKIKPGGNGNLFEYLDQEQPLDNKAAGEAAGYFDKEPKFKHTKRAKIALNEKESRVEEQLFAFFCFFKDTLRIRQFVEQIWADYASGKSGLTSAATTSNVAFDLLRHANEELIKNFPDMHHHGKVIKFFEEHGYLISKGNTKGSDEVPERKSSPAQKFELNLASSICSGIWKDVLEARSRHGLSSPPIKFNKDSKTSDLLWQDTELADALATDYFVSASIFRQSLGYQIFLGFCNLDGGNAENFPSWLVIAFDIIRKLDWTLWQNGVDQPYRELLETIEQLISRLKNAVDFAARWHIYEFPQLSHEHACSSSLMAVSLAHFFDDWIKGDQILGKKRKRWADAFKDQDSEKHFLLKHDPVFCGIILSEFKLMVHQYGLELAHRDNVLISSANLYNATLTSGASTEKWQDMEDLMAIHAADNTIFVGGRPTEPKDCSARYYTAMGYSIVNRAKGRSFMESFELRSRSRGRRIPYEMFTNPRRIKSTSVYAKAIGWSTLLESKLPNLKGRGGREKTYTWPGCQLPENMTCILPKIVDGQIKRYLEMQKRSLLVKDVEDPTLDEGIIEHWQANEELDQLQLLDVFYRSVEADDFHFCFDYFSMMERCMIFLTNFHKGALEGGTRDNPMFQSIPGGFHTLPGGIQSNILTMSAINWWAEVGDRALLQVAGEALTPLIREWGAIERFANHALAYRRPRRLQYIDIQGMPDGRNGTFITQLDRMFAYTLLQVSEKGFFQFMGHSPRKIPSDWERAALQDLRSRIQYSGDLSLKEFKEGRGPAVDEGMGLRDRVVLLSLFTSHGLPRREGEKDARMMMSIMVARRRIFAADEVPGLIGFIPESTAGDGEVEPDSKEKKVDRVKAVEDPFHFSEDDHILWGEGELELELAG